MFNSYQLPQNFMNNYYHNIPQNQFITRQVTSIDEAKAFIIDAFNTYLFIDMNTGKIYLKRMNNNGLSDFYTFSIEEPPEIKKPDPLLEINKRLTNIENKLGGMNNVQPVSNNAKSKSNDVESNDSSNEKSKSSAIS